jgi:adenylosuccinate lyase
VIIPDSITALYYMATLLGKALEGLEVNPERMRANVELTGGLVYSQRLMLELAGSGWERKRAYEKVQALASRAASEGIHLKELAAGDPEIEELLGPERVSSVFDPQYYLRYAEEILDGLDLPGEQ